MGNIQGVGFRRTVQKLARKFGIFGRIRNQKDGSVEILAQGETGKLESFLRSIRIREAPIMVEKLETEPAKVSNKVKIFEIMHGKIEEELEEGLGAGQEHLVLLRKDFGSYRKVFDSFSKSTNENFSTLADRYDKISQTLAQVLEESTQTRKDFTRALDELTKLAKEYFEDRRAERARESSNSSQPPAN